MKTTKKELIEKVTRLESQIQDARNERKEQFNKYTFIRELESEIKAEIENGNIDSEDDIREYIDSEIDNACIYYYKCFQIALELNATDFTEFDYEIKNISQLAYAALQELVNEKIDMMIFIELIAEKQNA